jgi:hypothetical protein
VDGAEVRVLKKPDHVRLCGLLEGEDGLGLEAQVALVLLGDFSHESLEWELADQQLRRRLELANLTEGHCARPESVGLLNATGSDWVRD